MFPGVPVRSGGVTVEPGVVEPGLPGIVPGVSFGVPVVLGVPGVPVVPGVPLVPGCCPIVPVDPGGPLCPAAPGLGPVPLDCAYAKHPVSNSVPASNINLRFMSCHLDPESGNCCFLSDGSAR